MVVTPASGPQLIMRLGRPTAGARIVGRQQKLSQIFTKGIAPPPRLRVHEIARTIVFNLKIFPRNGTLSMRAIAVLSAVMLACTALTPRHANADPVYDLSITSVRGSVTSQGTSYGSYNLTPTDFQFMDVDTPGSYPMDTFVPSSLLDPTTVSTTTLNYTSGTGGLAEQPVLAALTFPYFSSATTPLFYSMTGTISLTGTITNSGTGSRLQFTMDFTDPLNDTLLDELTENVNIVAGGAGNGEDSFQGSSILTIGKGAVSQDDIDLVTNKYTGVGTVVPEPGSAFILGAGISAFLFSRRRARTV